MSNPEASLAAVIGIGIACTWIAWRTRVPSILVLLAAGLVAGPVFGFINPDRILGDLLLPLVSLAVAIVLFEGGLSLRLDDLTGHGQVVTRLITLGVITTWLIGAAVGHLLLPFDWPLAFLFGSVVLVSGPTVVGPLLHHIRPARRVESILKWESIAIDPIGVLLAVLVFNGFVAGNLVSATAGALLDFLATVAIGVAAGTLGAGGLALVMRRFWIPDYLQAPMTLGVVLLAFAGSNSIQPESGLLTVVMMGIVLANQRFVDVAHIRAFKEDLRVVIIGALFVILAARIHATDLRTALLPALGVTAVLVVLARPIAVAVASHGSSLSWRERAFVAGLAPRGIVAAAASAALSYEITRLGRSGAEILLSATFLVVSGTVIVYGLGAPYLARALRISTSNPGCLIVGAHRFGRQVAQALAGTGRRIVLVDSDPVDAGLARGAGLEAVHANAVSDYALDAIELHGLSSMIALTWSDETNTLAAQHYVEAFGADHVYQIRPSETGDPARHRVGSRHRGRLLFGPELDATTLRNLIEHGASVDVVAIDGQSDSGARTRFGNREWPLFLVRQGEPVRPYSEGSRHRSLPNDRMVILKAPDASWAADSPLSDGPAVGTMS